MTAAAPSGPLDLAIITGLSGAGRSTAAKCLEDLGWFVVDNLPPALLSTMAELGRRSGGGVSRIAVVVDVRGRAFFADLRAALDALDAAGTRPRVLFLEASDDALIRRFDHVRRPHPLQGDGRVVDGISRERALLAELRGEADLVLDTTDLNVHELRSKIDAAFGQPGGNRLNATVISFGYRYGLPLDADLVADCRFLANPHWVEALRPFTGRDPQVRDYVLDQPGAKEFVDRYAELLRLVGEGYLREGKRYLTLAVGCTGGRHRSVAVAEELAARLAATGVGVQIVHRDLGRE
ncbi:MULTISPECIES: RNase adapter RapZ [unclassified Pseudofrankia]|uniref:RNase adapter RapZ n=1 Tax=unclassified Pseudofrankia TaxID=2994372 RepID=UPI0008D92619|nr:MULTISPECIES: RNase adapter RapZ [unclassified Pseudofrankia]MDT3438373.1 RNase adapter RapZ [Pseudofrankia sp. BMG5.37]OHV46048.1 RNase adaptor protein RapZ [Pseudofrankia sp. BMG5.36]